MSIFSQNELYIYIHKVRIPPLFKNIEITEGRISFTWEGEEVAGVGARLVAADIVGTRSSAESSAAGTFAGTSACNSEIQKRSHSTHDVLCACYYSTIFRDLTAGVRGMTHDMTLCSQTMSHEGDGRSIMGLLK